jgi:hypothetical protein
VEISAVPSIFGNKSRIRDFVKPKPNKPRLTFALDRRAASRHGPGIKRGSIMAENAATTRINWAHVSTVLSAAILIGAEVFGAAFAAGWAFSGLFGLSDTGMWVLQGLFGALGVLIMVAFVRTAKRVEPFVTRA